MNITIIGLGLIGGSIAREMMALGHRVVGVDNRQEHCDKALSLGLITETMSLDEAISNTEVIAVCVPVDVIEIILKKVLDGIKDHHVVFDVGSTKRLICKSCQNHPMRSRFVAAHPMAGTEKSGPTAALLNLFKHKKNIICEAEKSDASAVDIVEFVFRSMGMESYYLDPDEHDKHMAFVSHLSHVSSFALSQTVLDIEKDESQIFNLASTGFASTARLAKCNPHTWTAIFSKNSHYLSEALEAYIYQIQKFKSMVDDLRLEDMHKAIVEANEIERVLNGIALNQTTNSL